ncbi:MAG: VWA domain-containing protein [Planctomycetes bacterium]|nr:VWA domain-containing protein [Planctomycetota bacterium]
MTLTAPLGLLALLGVPLVVLLHLYRRRLRERRTAAVFLFLGERLVTDAGRTRTRLLRTPSLWLECLMALLLALWLAGPSFGGAAARHVVFVLDDSASMLAGGREAALAAVEERLAALSSHDRVSVLRTGPRPEVLVGPRALPSEITPALGSWRPARPRHDPLPALDLARELAAGLGEVVFCTDEMAPSGSDGIEVLAVGKVAPNAAILTAQRLRRAAGGEELRVRIAGYGGIFTADVAAYAGTTVLLSQPVDLGSGHGDISMVLPPGTGMVRVELGRDALAIDNEAFLLAEPERIVHVCDLLPDEVRQRLELPRVFAALSGHVVDPDPLASQLLLSTRPGRPVSGQTEVVIDPGAGERDGWRGPFVVDRGSAWLSGIHLQGVVWLAGRKDPPGRVLAAVGNRTLLSEEFVSTGRRLWINLDPSAGNIMRAPDWPLLFANLIEASRDEVPGPVASNLVLGDEARYRRTLQAEAEDAELWLEGPTGERVAGRGDRVVGWVLDRPGAYRVLGRTGRELGSYAARFHDPSESDLRKLTTAHVLPDPATDDGDGSLRDTTIERRLLGLLLLLLAVADWWLLAGRRS